MRIGEVINTLRRIKDKYGDLPITGYREDVLELKEVVVVDVEGTKIWPQDLSVGPDKPNVKGVMFE